MGLWHSTAAIPFQFALPRPVRPANDRREGLVHTLPEYLAQFAYFGLVVASLVLLTTFRLLRRIPFLALYLAFSGLRTIWMAPSLLRDLPDAYWAVYWPLQGVGYCLTSLLSLSLVNRQWASKRMLAAVVVLLPFLAAFYQQAWHPWLYAAMFADLFSCFVLVCALQYGREWRQPQRGIAIGLVVGLAGHLLCALLQDGDPKLWLRLAYQSSAIVQVSVWWWTLRRATRPEALAEGAEA